MPYLLLPEDFALKHIPEPAALFLSGDRKAMAFLPSFASAFRLLILSFLFRSNKSSLLSLAVWGLGVGAEAALDTSLERQGSGGKGHGQGNRRGQGKQIKRFEFQISEGLGTHQGSS